MYEVKWMPKTAAELEELCNKATEHGFELVACNDTFCVFKSAQHSVQRTDGTCKHLSVDFDYICMRCGDLVPAIRR